MSAPEIIIAIKLDDEFSVALNRAAELLGELREVAAGERPSTWAAILPPPDDLVTVRVTSGPYTGEMFGRVADAVSDVWVDQLGNQITWGQLRMYDLEEVTFPQ